MGVRRGTGIVGAALKSYEAMSRRTSRLPLVVGAIRALRAKHLDYGRRHIAGFVLIGATLACAALAGVAWAAGFDRIADVIGNPHPVWFAAALGGELVAYLGYIIAYHEVTRPHPASNVRFLESAAAVAVGFGMFVARGGFAADVEVLDGRCDSSDDARTRVLGLSVLEYVILAPVTCVAACLILVGGSHVSPSFTIPWAVGVPAGAVVALALIGFRQRFAGRGGWRGRIARGLDALQLLHRLTRRPVRALVALVGMALYWAGDAFCLWACLYGFLGRPFSATALVVAYASGYALTRRTLPLAGAGVVEALLPFALLWVSMPLAAALWAVLAYRFFNLWLPLVPAVLGFRHLRAAGA
jgi:uncharacterized membrane protein YbhN (UPF0104 family)